MNKKAVIFDFGGVMHTVKDLKTRETIAEGLGVPIEQIKQLLIGLINKLGIGEISEDDFWNNISNTIGRDLPDNYKSLIRDRLAMIAEIYPEMVELVTKLKQAGIKTAVLSNSIAPHEEVLRNKGAYDIFDVVVLSHLAKMRKPDKEIYEHILQLLQLNAKECVMVDDLEENLVTARNLGMAVVLAQNPNQVINDLMSLLEL